MEPPALAVSLEHCKGGSEVFAAASPMPVRAGRRREGGPLQVPLAEVPPTQKMPFKGLFCYLSIYLD